MVAQHLCSARHTALVATCLTDDGGRLTSDGTLVDRGESLDYLTVGRYNIAGVAYKLVALLQRRAADGLDSAVYIELCRHLLACLAQAVGLSLATCLGYCLCKVGKQQCDEEDEQYPCVVCERALLAAECGINRYGQHDGGANLHREHDRVLYHLPRVKLNKRLLDARYYLFFFK